MADVWHELPHHEQAGWQCCGQVQRQSDTVVASVKPVLFRGCCVGSEVASHVEVLEARKAEAEHGACEDDNYRLVRGLPLE